MEKKPSKCLDIDEKSKVKCLSAGAEIERYFKEVRDGAKKRDIETIGLNTIFLIKALGKAEGCGVDIKPVKEMDVYANEIMEILITRTALGKTTHWNIIDKSVKEIEKNLEKTIYETISKD